MGKLALIDLLLKLGDTVQQSPFALEILLYSVFGTIFTVCLIIMLILLGSVIISKRTARIQLQNMQARINQLSSVYEEIGTDLQCSSVRYDDLDKNVAYDL